MPTAAYRPEARTDIDSAYSAYEALRVGLGERFLDELMRVIGIVEGNPLLYGEVVDGIRAAVLRRFPYVVYYRGSLNEALIIAVRHGHGDPSIWQSRIPPP